MEQFQGEQRAEHGRGQTGENRDRVDQALVENAQYDVDHEHRDQQQNRQTAEGVLESLHRPAEICGEAGGDAHLAQRVFHGVGRIAE